MKPLLAILAGLFLASAAFAQVPENRNEVFVGIGDPGLVFAIDSALESIVDEICGESSGSQRGGLQVSAGYQRWFSRWSSMGVSGSWAYARKPNYFFGTPAGEIERNLLTVTGDWHAHWLRRPSWDFYSGLAVGASNYSTTWTDSSGKDRIQGTFPTFSLIPIGARFGKEWGGFAETGIGLNGFFRGGLSRRY